MLYNGGSSSFATCKYHIHYTLHTIRYSELLINDKHETELNNRDGVELGPLPPL